MIQELVALHEDNQRDVLLEFIQATRAEHMQRGVSSSVFLALFITLMLLVAFLLRTTPALCLFPLGLAIWLVHRLWGRRTLPREWLGPIPKDWLSQGALVRDLLKDLPKSMLPEILRLGEVLEALPHLPEARQRRGYRLRRANRMVSEVQAALFLTLGRLLPRLDPEELAQLTAQNRAYLCRAIQRSSDTSFITALFLTLASAGERTLLPLAHDYIVHHPAENVREAAQEYLHAVENTP